MIPGVRKVSYVERMEKMIILLAADAVKAKLIHSFEYLMINQIMRNCIEIVIIPNYDNFFLVNQLDTRDLKIPSELYNSLTSSI